MGLCIRKAARLAQDINLKAGIVLIDWQSLEKSCFNKEDLLLKVLCLFTDQTHGWIQDLKTAVSGHDPDKTRMVCHVILGATAAMHAEACVESVRKLG
jgi:hypothetical protein